MQCIVTHLVRREGPSVTKQMPNKRIKISSRKSYRNWLCDIVKNGWHFVSKVQPNSHIVDLMMAFLRLLRLLTEATTNALANDLMNIEQVILSVSLSCNFLQWSVVSESSPSCARHKNESFFSNTNLLCMFIMSETTCYIISNVCASAYCVVRLSVRGKREKIISGDGKLSL